MSPARQRLLAGLARRAAAAEGPLRESLLARHALWCERSRPRLGDALAPADGQHLAALRAALPEAAPELRTLSADPHGWAALRLQGLLAMPLAPEVPVASLGPLHAQVVLPRALQQLRHSAPDYLQGLLAWVEGLAVLDAAVPTAPAAGRASAARIDKAPKLPKPMGRPRGRR